MALALLLSLWLLDVDLVLTWKVVVAVGLKAKG